MSSPAAFFITAVLGLACLAPSSPAPAVGMDAPARRTELPAPDTGRVEQFTLHDSSYGRERKVWVYTPPGYNPRRDSPYPLVVAFDGAEYQDDMPLPSILDSLLASGAAPAFIGVLIDDSGGAERIADLGNVAKMPEFLGRQLIPWLRRSWNVTHDPHRTIITGSSAGGLGAAYVAFMLPGIFGNVHSQSGAFWRGPEASNDAPWEWLTAQFSKSARKDIRIWMEVGSGEDHPTLGGRGPNFLAANRRLRDALKKKGYDLTYFEVPGGNHAPRWWRPRLPVGIAGLSGGWSRP